VAGEVQHHRAPVQHDTEPALRFGVDLCAKPTQDIHYVLHFEIGIERMREDRVKDFALMVVHGRASLMARVAYDKISAIDASRSPFGGLDRR